ncbi:hypothetical protein [Zhihengliuella salsuginis]|uniref:Uncharacterized protein n=1 Tax=Zhihengliuella salsuginis TaxID=578222 RepID=A0ABQ3GJ34_9MICC|nr:hypothetical protein [Zhihengliuella salsuginis]GHD06013.1 hypothetical protein GCM10008096_15500 [Zhihengliuella salsuginis]
MRRARHAKRSAAALAVAALAAAPLAACSSEEGECPLPPETIADYLMSEANPTEQTVAVTPDEEQPKLCMYTRTFADAETGTFNRISIDVGWSDGFTEEDFEARVAEFEADDDDATFVEELNGTAYTVDEDRGAGVRIDGEHYWVAWNDYRDGLIHRPALASAVTGRDAAHIVRLLILTNAGENPGAWKTAEEPEDPEPSPATAAPEEPATRPSGSSDWDDTPSDPPDELLPPPAPPEPEAEEAGEGDVDMSGSTDDEEDSADHELVGTRLTPPDVLTAVFELWETPGYPMCANVMAGGACVQEPREDGDNVVVTALRTNQFDGADDYTRDTAVMLGRNDDGSWTVLRYWETEDPLGELPPDWAI